MSRSTTRVLLFALFAVTLVYLVVLRWQSGTYGGYPVFLGSIGSNNLSENNVITYKGPVSMEELNENVFKKFGYEITIPTYPVPTLKMHNEPKCDQVFADWLKVSKERQPPYPPKVIPENRKNEFLLNDYVAVNKFYINDKNSATGEKPKNWNIISDLMVWPKRKVADLAYGKDSLSIYHAMQHHRLDGQSGVVIGSMQPWVEVSALRNGASRVLTVEYNPLDIQSEYRPFLSSMLTADFVHNYREHLDSFDFAASFSSIEHSGLGRYGDPIDPIGDLREMLKIKCILKKGALLFLGLPLGTDALSFNAHRIYGPIRLAMMFHGFEWINTFNGDSEQPFDMNAFHLHHDSLFEHRRQYTMVLRKLF